MDAGVREADRRARGAGAVGGSPGGPTGSDGGWPGAWGGGVGGVGASIVSTPDEPTRPPAYLSWHGSDPSCRLRAFQDRSQNTRGGLAQSTFAAQEEARNRAARGQLVLTEVGRGRGAAAQGRW